VLRIINLHDKKVFRSVLLINESMTTLLFNALNNIKIIHVITIMLVQKCISLLKSMG